MAPLQRSVVLPVSVFFGFSQSSHVVLMLISTPHCCVVSVPTFAFVVAGLYCPTSATSPVACPAGSYCGAGALSPIICPSPTVFSNVASTSTSACVADYGRTIGLCDVVCCLLLLLLFVVCCLLVCWCVCVCVCVCVCDNSRT